MSFVAHLHNNHGHKGIEHSKHVEHVDHTERRVSASHERREAGVSRQAKESDDSHSRGRGH